MIKTLKVLISLVQLWNFYTVAMALMQSKTAIRVEEYDELYFTTQNIADLFDVVSATRCANFCGQNQACLTFFYNKPQKRCRLHQAGFFDKKEGEVALNWRFYAFENKDCPTYHGFYQESNGLCLHVATDKLNFIDGQKRCSNLHSRVVTLETTGKRLAVETFKNRQELVYRLPHENVWLGLQKTYTGWQWESGKSLEQEGNWGIGQPHCPQQKTGCYCAAMIKAWSDKWNDGGCHRLHAVICEYLP